MPHLAHRRALILAIKGGPALIAIYTAFLAFNFRGEESTSLTSTSTTSSLQEFPTEWLIGTKAGTPLLAYKALILSLPDGGTGSQIVYPNLNFQGYVCIL